MFPLRFISALMLFTWVNPVTAGPHEIQATGHLGMTMPALGVSGQVGASFRMDDTWGLDTNVAFIQGFSEQGIERLVGATMGATYQLDVTQVVPFLQFRVGIGHLLIEDEGRPTLFASIGFGLLRRLSDQMDLGVAMSKVSDLGLSQNLSPPIQLDLVFRYRFER